MTSEEKPTSATGAWVSGSQSQSAGLTVPMSVCSHQPSIANTTALEPAADPPPASAKPTPEEPPKPSDVLSCQELLQGSSSDVPPTPPGTTSPFLDHLKWAMTFTAHGPVTSTGTWSTRSSTKVIDGRG